MSQQVNHFGETPVHGVTRSIKFTSLREASEDFGNRRFEQLFYTQIVYEWEHRGGGLVLRYEWNALLHSMCTILQNGLSYNCQPVHCTTSADCLGLDWKVEYTDANEEIIPEFHNIWGQYTDSDLDNTFQV
jgi:hypothetical protein